MIWPDTSLQARISDGSWGGPSRLIFGTKPGEILRFGHGKAVFILFLLRTAPLTLSASPLPQCEISIRIRGGGGLQYKKGGGARGLT